MGRPRKWANDAERMAAKRCSDIPVNEQDKRTPIKRTHKRTGITWHPEISQDRFNGRGIPVDGYVLVSLGAVAEGSPDCGVVSDQDWRERLTYTCTHRLAGWSCKECITQ